MLRPTLATLAVITLTTAGTGLGLLSLRSDDDAPPPPVDCALEMLGPVETLPAQAQVPMENPNIAEIFAELNAPNSVGGLGGIGALGNLVGLGYTGVAPAPVELAPLSPLPSGLLDGTGVELVFGCNGDPLAEDRMDLPAGRGAPATGVVQCAVDVPLPTPCEPCEEMLYDEGWDELEAVDEPTTPFGWMRVEAEEEARYAEEEEKALAATAAWNAAWVKTARKAERLGRRFASGPGVRVTLPARQDAPENLSAFVYAMSFGDAQACDVKGYASFGTTIISGPLPLNRDRAVEHWVALGEEQYADTLFGVVAARDADEAVRRVEESRGRSPEVMPTPASLMTGATDYVASPLCDACGCAEDD